MKFIFELTYFVTVFIAYGMTSGYISTINAINLYNCTDPT